MKSIVCKGIDFLLAVIRTTIPYDPNLEISEILPQDSLERKAQGPATVVGRDDYGNGYFSFRHAAHRLGLYPSLFASALAQCYLGAFADHRMCGNTHIVAWFAYASSKDRSPSIKS